MNESGSDKTCECQVCKLKLFFFFFFHFSHTFNEQSVRIFFEKAKFKLKMRHKFPLMELEVVRKEKKEKLSNRRKHLSYMQRIIPFKFFPLLHNLIMHGFCIYMDANILFCEIFL